MKTLPSRFAPGVAAVLVAASACLAAATVVDAQTSPANGAPSAARMPKQPGGPDGMGMHHGGPEMHMMRELNAFKTSLQLNTQQSALWDRAVAAMKPQGDMREQMKARHDQMLSMLDDPNFDPRKMAAAMDRFDAERKAKMQTVRDAWFSVYDSLNPVQRGQVREFLRERMSRRHRWMHGHGEWMHHHDDGHRPMPPDAPQQR